MSAATSPDACVGDDQARPPPGLPSGEAVAHHAELVRAVTEKLSKPETVWVVDIDDIKYGGDDVEVFASRNQAAEWIGAWLEDNFGDDAEVVEAVARIQHSNDCGITERIWFSIRQKTVRR